MDSPAKLSTQGTQDEKKSKQKQKNKTQYNTLFVGCHYAQTNTNNINKTWHTAFNRSFSIGQGIFCRGTRGQMCYYSCMGRPWFLLHEEFEDNKRVTRIRISKKNIQHSGQKKKYKRSNSDRQSMHIKQGLSNTNPITDMGWTQVLRKGKQFMHH
jgi:hypothetical protein